MTPADLDAISRTQAALAGVRGELRSLRSRRVDYGSHRAKLRAHAAEVRATAPACSAVIYEVRTRLMTDPSSSAAHSALTTTPIHRRHGPWASEIALLEYHFDSKEVLAFRAMGIKRHGKMRRRSLSQDPFSGEEEFAAICRRVLRELVDPLKDVQKRGQLRRRCKRAEVWISGLIILLENSKVDIEHVYQLSYSMSTAVLARRI
jgi:hypothetical protein